MNRISSSSDIPVFSIPVASIAIDGDTADWSGSTPILTDEKDDSFVAGADIEYIKIAVISTETRGYTIIKVSNGNISTNCKYRITVSSSTSRILIYYSGKDGLRILCLSIELVLYLYCWR